MRSLLSIAFGFVTLLIIISITASEEPDPSKFNYSFPVYTFSLKPQTNEITSSGSGRVSSTEVLRVSTSISSASTASPSETNPLSTQSPSVSAVALNAEDIKKLGDILEQDKAVATSPKAPQITEQTTASKADASTSEINVTNNNSTDSMLTNGTSSPTTSVPKVGLPNEETETYINGFLKKSFSWLGDQYTLSIVVPILAGFLFAMVIIVTIATFTCIRRRCRRRRLRKKILPETIRKMGPSDRARLLAETSDEEF